MRASTAILAAVGAAFLINGRLGAQEVGPGPVATIVPEISATGTGEVRTVPDRATIVLGVETRAATAAEAGSENAEKQTAVIAALRKAGVAESDIGTVSYTMNPETQYDDSTRTSRVVGYVARNMVRVQVKDIARIGGYIDAAIAAGANGVNSLDFTSSRAEEFRRGALRSAIQAACRDAAVMAEAAGGRLGTLLQAVSNEGAGYPPPRPMYMEMQAARAKDTPISPGEMTLTVTVQTRWRFLTGVGEAANCGG